MRARPFCHIAITLTFASAFATAQSACGSQLQALDVPSGIDGALNDSVLWDRDGSGPLPAELVIGGAFRRVGGIVANGVARRDALLGWVPLGAGCDGVVQCLAVDGANRLVVGGSFTTAGASRRRASRASTARNGRRWRRRRRC
jgi:hypothetical protein